MRRVSLGLVEALTLPVTDMWPTCDLCTAPLDAIELVENAGPTAVRVLGKHHGQEELATLELGTREWAPDDVQRSVRGHRWFRPESKSAGERADWELDRLADGVPS